MAVPGQRSSNPFPTSNDTGGGLDFFKRKMQGAADQIAAMPNAPPVAPAQPAVTVRKGAYQAGARRPVQAPVQREQGMNMGDYDNGMGGMFGEAEQEGRGRWTLKSVWSREGMGARVGGRREKRGRRREGE